MAVSLFASVQTHSCIHTNDDSWSKLRSYATGFLSTQERWWIDEEINVHEGVNVSNNNMLFSIVRCYYRGVGLWEHPVEVTGNYNQCFLITFYFSFILLEDKSRSKISKSHNWFFKIQNQHLQTSRSQETYEGKPHQARFADKCRHKD